MTGVRERGRKCREESECKVVTVSVGVRVRPAAVTGDGVGVRRGRRGPSHGLRKLLCRDVQLPLEFVLHACKKPLNATGNAACTGVYMVMSVRCVSGEVKAPASRKFGPSTHTHHKHHYKYHKHHKHHTRLPHNKYGVSATAAAIEIHWPADHPPLRCCRERCNFSSACSSWFRWLIRCCACCSSRSCSSRSARAADSIIPLLVTLENFCFMRSMRLVSCWISASIWLMSRLICT